MGKNMLIKIYHKVRRRSGYAFGDLKGSLSLNKSLFRHTRGARIVVYHGLCEASPTRFNSLFLRAKTFERHLQFYRKYCHIVSLEEYYAGKFSKDRFNICITFDDGFANNYKYALPLMNKYEAPMTFFITGIRDAGYDFLWNDFLAFLQNYGPPEFSLWDDLFYKDRRRGYASIKTGVLLKDRLREGGFAEKAEMIKLLKPILMMKDKGQEADYWLQMTPDEIKALSASPLATIGCHGYYHNDLSKISLPAAEEEMIRSREYLGRIIDKRVNALAFPYGAYTRELLEAAKRAGFDQLLALDWLFPEDATEDTLRQRLVVNPYISVNNQMTAILHGKYK